jgi:hypothetical protein
LSDAADDAEAILAAHPFGVVASAFLLGIAIGRMLMRWSGKVDESPIVVSCLVIDGVTRSVVRPLEFAVSFEPAEGIYTAIGEFHMMAAAETRDELKAAVDAALIALWHEYVASDPLNFSADALVLREQLASIFLGAAHAA